MIDLRKDEALDRCAERINVAQFVSFVPSPNGPLEAYARILGDPPNARYESMRAAIQRLIERSPDSTVNVRSYKPHDPRSWPFVYGLANLDDVVSHVDRLIGEGLHVIVNETVDVSDGGVSGVVEGEIAEFAPDDTPRCVEKPGTASLPLNWALRTIAIVYGFRPEIDLGPDVRLEFSVHPRPRGWRGTRTLGWELEKLESVCLKPTLHWPNRFSRLMGDKTYGLIMAELAGMRVPYTTVFGRRLDPFSFGSDTGSLDVWVRTCPREQVEGKFATKHGWTDPYQLMAQEDPVEVELEDPDTAERARDFLISSAIVQMGVRPVHSGSFNVDSTESVVIEGVSGTGDAFMVGKRPPESLPDVVLNAVKEAYTALHGVFGPVRFEWVFDGNDLWIVQLHRGQVAGAGEIIVPGDADSWRVFDISKGLEALRSEIASLVPGEGLKLKGQFGQTSHIADVVRRAGRPARLA